ncbi:MAG: DUF881 domain-containing protein [Jiangellaceae bacterium]|nr:DUF881 domain-containing protein [Jiangellaceae bacterium]
MTAVATAGTGWRFVAPVALAGCGLLLVVSARAAGGEELRAPGYTEVADLIRAQERRTEELSAELNRLSAEVEELAAARASRAGEGVRERVAALEQVAGFTPVRGPGLTVTLDDAPLPVGALDSGVHLEDYVVHQQDLEAVINALWAGGAEAMMVMDQRVVATSTIRCVGPVLLLQGRRYAPPYTITAIGDVDAMEQALDESEEVAEYLTYVEYLGLGYDVDRHDEVTLPEYDGPIEISEETAA